MLHLAALASLLIAAPPLSPRAVLSIPHPDRVLPRAVKELEWLALAEPTVAPAAIRRLLGFDPFDPVALAAAGVDPKKPAWIWLGVAGDAGTLVLELELAKPEAVDLIFTAAVARGFERFAFRAGEGVALGSGVSRALVIARVKKQKRLFVQLGSGALRELGGGLRLFPPAQDQVKTGTASALAILDRIRPLEAVLRQKKPRAPPRVAMPAKRGEPPADIWGTSLPGAAVPGADGAVWLLEDGFDLRLDLRVSFQADLVVAAVAPAGHVRSQPLIDPAAFQVESAAELTTFLTGAGASAAAEQVRVAPDVARAFDGPVHVVLGGRGEIVLAAELAPAPKPKAASHEEVARAIAALRPSARAIVTERGGKRLLVAWLGEQLPDDAVKKAALTAPASEARAPLELRAAPKLVFEAMRARSAARDGLGPSSLELVFLRMTLKPLFDATRSVRAEIEAPPGRIRTRLEVKR